MSDTKKCSFCKQKVGDVYWIYWRNYICRDCKELDKDLREFLLKNLPDSLEELEPIDNRYQLGIIAASEARARAYAEKCYHYTPSPEDKEC